MWLRMLSALAFPLLCVSCGTPVVRQLTPPAPPAWVMQPCPPWPLLGGDGRVALGDLARVIAEAKVAHSVCGARLEGLQHFMTEVVRPE